MGAVRITRSGDRLEDRLAALTLTLARPEDVLIPAAHELSQLIQANAPVESGILRSGFTEITLMKTASGTAVLIGNPQVLPTTQGDKPPAHTIQDFVNWVRGLNQQAQKGNARRWAGVKREFAARRAEKMRVRTIAKAARARRVAAVTRRAARVQRVATQFRGAVKEYLVTGKRPSAALLRQMRQPRVRATQSMRSIVEQEYRRMYGEAPGKELNVIMREFRSRRH